MFKKRRSVGYRLTGSTLYQTVSRNCVKFTSDRLNFREMQKGDLDQIVNIERMSFLSPWKWEHFQSELEKDFGISIIAEVDQFIVGYLIGWFVANEIHIGNIAVHPKWRRKGIGEMMIQKLLTEYKSCSLVQLEVRFSNRAARSLYRKLGFYEIGIRKNYYTFEREDAVLMEKRLSI